jgi:hypothetical protein
MYPLAIPGIGLAISSRVLNPRCKLTMNSLPKVYIRVAREITGYWGAYPPSMSIAPGMIGRPVGGLFICEGNLNQYPGFNSKSHTIEEQPSEDTTSIWTTRRVTTETLVASVDLPLAVQVPGIRFRFDGANEMAIVCHEPRRRAFTNLQSIKDLMRGLLESEVWDRELCVVTEVLAVSSGWICFATGKSQSVELRAAVPPTTSLTPLVKVNASAFNEQFAGHLTKLQSGGTPLFMAIRFSKHWLPLRNREAIGYVKGGNQEFVEPDFSETAD